VIDGIGQQTVYTGKNSSEIEGVRARRLSRKSPGSLAELAPGEDAVRPRLDRG
jgi:hypothetical protein